MIYNFTFIAPEEAVLKVRRAYRPPIQLHINRSLRKQLGTSYHRKTTLSFCDINVLNKWLEALAPDARDMLRSINYEHDPSRSSSCDGADRISRFSIEQRIWQLLIEKGVPSPSEVMSTKDYVLFKLCRGR